MLCELHRKQDQIYEPYQQFARHLELGTFLLEKQAFREAEEMLGCAFELYERGLIDEDKGVVFCFARLLQALEAQQKDDLVRIYLDKGQGLNFRNTYSDRPALRIVRTDRNNDRKNDE